MDESEVEDDLDVKQNKRKKVQVSDDSSDGSDQVLAGKGNVYKAPKLNAVAFEDPKDKKAR